MAFKKRSTTGERPGSKAYFWLSADYGNGMKGFTYVTADTPATVEVSGYFDDAELEAVMKPGDSLRVLQVAALDDDRSIQDDLAAGLVDESLHTVVASDGSGINISGDLLVATVSYTS